MDKKFLVIESDGLEVKKRECTSRYGYNGGWVYKYRNGNGLEDIVLVPHKYHYGLEDGSFLIGKNVGNSSAAVLWGKGAYMVGASVDRDAPGDDLSLLARTHVAAMGYKSLYEKQMPWKWLIIGIAVVVVIGAVVLFIRSRGA